MKMKKVTWSQAVSLAQNDNKKISKHMKKLIEQEENKKISINELISKIIKNYDQRRN